MVETQVIWLAPLLILPGISLLIVSTSSRFANLHTEVHHWITQREHPEVIQMADLDKRAKLFRNALVSLYACVFAFVLASAAGAVVEFGGGDPDVVVFSIAMFGILCLAYGSIALVRESMLSLEIIQSHMNTIEAHHENH